jgi:hypothetical protein
MCVALDHPGRESVLEEVTAAGVAAVDPHCVDAVQPLHPAGELGLRGLDEQVEVVVEQVPRMHAPGEAPLHLEEELEPGLAVAIVEHDRPLLHAAADDVVPGRARKLAARDPRHEPSTVPRGLVPRNRREGTTSRDSPWDTSFADVGGAD